MELQNQNQTWMDKGRNYLLLRGKLKLLTGLLGYEMQSDYHDNQLDINKAENQKYKEQLDLKEPPLESSSSENTDMNKQIVMGDYTQPQPQPIIVNPPQQQSMSPLAVVGMTAATLLGGPALGAGTYMLLNSMSKPDTPVDTDTDSVVDLRFRDIEEFQD